MSIQKTIPGLDPAAALDGTEYAELSQGGKSVKSLLSAIATFITSSFTGSGSITSTGTITSGTWSAKFAPRVKNVTQSATPAPNADTDDQYNLTAQGINCTFTNPAGTPAPGQNITLRIATTTTTLTINFGSAYRFSTDLANPITITLACTTYYEFKYNSAASKWDCITILSNF